MVSVEINKWACFTAETKLIKRRKKCTHQHDLSKFCVYLAFISNVESNCLGITTKKNGETKT